MEQLTAQKNWAGNLAYGAAAFHRPESTEQLQSLVAGSPKARALGSRHSFNAIAATPSDLISLERMPEDIQIDTAARTVRVGAAIRYGTLAAHLQRHGFALPNLASLPHISVGGAVATGTHGSGDNVGNLATAVSALELVLADGSLLRVDRDDPDFAGMVVSLGALGIVTHLELELLPAFDVAQRVHEDLHWDRVLADFDALTSSAYSVSLFTDWRGATIGQAWFKQRAGDDPLPPAGIQDFGGRAATVPRHPIPRADGAICSTQLGQPGPWSERLAHFRMDFTPSAGAELQSEYLLPREHAPAAISTLRGLSPLFGELLLVSEIRTIAADDLWLSGNFGRAGIGLHFTWRPDQPAVQAVLPLIEQALQPFAARPHWGKLFAMDAVALAGLYPRFADFIALANRLDPRGKFRNEFLERTVFGR